MEIFTKEDKIVWKMDVIETRLKILKSIKITEELRERFEDEIIEILEEIKKIIKE